MPMYMDRHSVPEGMAPEDLALAHLEDEKIQSKYGVTYLRYYFHPDSRKVFCLIQAPNLSAAVAVHRESHGLVAEEIREVDSETAEKMLGTVEEMADWTPDSSVAAPVESCFRTILFTDMEGSTRMTQRLGDMGHMEVLRNHDSIIRDAFSALGGREIKHTGDGIMACFDSVTRAVECATAIQRGFDSHNRQGPASPIRVRVGLSAGEPVEQHRDLYGAAVQMAARICRLAEPERILASNVIRELAIGKGFAFKDRGEVTLRGFDDPVRVYEVMWRD